MIKSIFGEKKISLFFLLNIVCFGSISTAQTSTTSPYSRYGIGDIGGKGFAQGFSMGGTHIAMQNDSLPMFFNNSGNPASYSNNRLTTAELGANYSLTQLVNNSSEQKINNASLAYVSMTFPVKKWWGTGIGLIPFSAVGYKVSDKKTVTNIGDVDFLYEGTGGINQVYWGNSIKPFYKLFKQKKLHDLSLGVNASYLFGNFQNIKRSIFPESLQAFNTKSITATRINDFYFDYGMQYAYTIDSIKRRDLKENVKIIAGATFSAQTDLYTKVDSISYSYFVNGYGSEKLKDTIESVENVEGTTTFPLSFGFGLAIKKGDRITVATDFSMQNWSAYRAFNQSQNLKNSMRISLGLQYIPNSKANSSGSYGKRINYRLGVRYLQTALELKNTQLKEYAISTGVGLPVGRSFILQNFSMVNISIEVGARGTTKNGLIRENFLKANIGFTINDRWFQKPKFD